MDSLTFWGLDFLTCQRLQRVSVEISQPFEENLSLITQYHLSVIKSIDSIIDS